MHCGRCSTVQWLFQALKPIKGLVLPGVVMLQLAGGRAICQTVEKDDICSKHWGDAVLMTWKRGMGAFLDCVSTVMFSDVFFRGWHACKASVIVLFNSEYWHRRRKFQSTGNKTKSLWVIAHQCRRVLVNIKQCHSFIPAFVRCSFLCCGHWSTVKI